MSRHLKLTNGASTLVDDDVFEDLSRFSWRLDSTGYATRIRSRGQRPRKQYLHRFLMGEPDGYTDHINRDKLDNRRVNLRVTTNSLNMLNAGVRSTNRSGHSGVCLNRTRKKWRAYITVNYRQVWLGTFDTLAAAVRARADAHHQLDPEVQT